MSTTRWWAGTYPAAGAGTPAGAGEGIWRVHADAQAGQVVASSLVVRTPAPSFLATHPAGGGVVYACGETGQGTVTAFTVTPDGGLTPGPVVSSGGGHPCHLALSAGAHTLYVANYSSGTVAVLPVDPDGNFSPAVLHTGGPVQVVANAGSGPHVSRQAGPHSHQVTVAPGGATLLVTDLGTDELRRYTIGPGGYLTHGGTAARLPPGTGPRHLTIGPARGQGDRSIYLVGELAGTVDVLRWDPYRRSAELVQRVTAAASTTSAASSGTSRTELLPSHISLHGNDLVVAVRKLGRLAVRPVDPVTGLLGKVRETPTGGTWPRHFALMGDLALVANQGSGTLGLVRLRTKGASELLGTSILPAVAAVVPVI